MSYSSNHKPFVVFVFPTERSETSTRYAGFGKRLKKAGGFKDHDILTVALENIAFVTYEDGTAEAIDTVTGTDLGDAAFVYLKSWEAMPEEAAALSTYLFYKGVPFADSLPMGMGVSKLATMMRLWGSGVRMPHTVYVRRPDRLGQFLLQHKALQLGDKFIVKDVVGAKGKLNFHVGLTEALAILNEHSDVQFVCQRFIENEGDYRVGVYADQSAFIIKRTGVDGSHLNNTSVGGKAQYIPVDSAPAGMTEAAEKAASAAELQFAGVDLIEDTTDGSWLTLEVNQGSQIVTGAYVEENMAAFVRNFDRVLRHVYAKPHKQPRRLIGRRSIAALPDFGITQAVAKIDTGAYSSSMHATDIEVRADAEGTEWLCFTILLSDKLHIADGKRTVRTKDFSMRKVRSSNGKEERRYSIKTPVILEGQEVIADLTLTDRSRMSYPLLIGRRALRSRFIVNVELNEHHRADWKY